MRLMTVRSLGGLLAVFLLIGCDGKPKPKGKIEGTGSGSSAPAVLAGPSARPAADAFLASLRDGKATPDQLSTAFKKQLGKSSPGELQDWLSQFQGTNFVVGDESKFGNALVLRGRAQAPQLKNAFTLRMAKEGDAFKADWLHRSDRMGSGMTTPADSDLAAAQDTARNFLDLLLGGDLRLAQALMTLPWKQSESGWKVGSPAKDGAEYDAGFLVRVLRSWRNDFIGYTLTKPELSAGKDAATFTAEMDRGPQGKTPYTVKAKKLDGQWQIESFAK